MGVVSRSTVTMRKNDVNNEWASFKLEMRDR